MYDAIIEPIPGHEYARKEDALYQVVVIERDGMGRVMRRMWIEDTDLTHDKAGSVWNQVRQRLQNPKRGTDK